METPDDLVGGRKTLEDGTGSAGPGLVQAGLENGGGGGGGSGSVEGNATVVEVTGGVTTDKGKNGGGDVVECSSEVAAGEEEEAQMKEMGDEKKGKVVIGDGSNGVEKGADFAEKIQVSGDGISLVVDVHGSSNGIVNVEKIVCKENGASKSEVREEKKNGCQNIGNKEKATLLVQNGEDPDGKVGENVEEMQVEGEKKFEENEFSVGDLVWGKVKGRAWWPGKIYNPSVASKNAVRYHRKDCLLVAFFGDDTFAWCYPSQLKPFLEKFEEMSVQGTSVSFFRAVDEAAQEFGKRVESEMACSCVALGSQPSSEPPLSLNVGIKGVAMSEGGIGKFYITLYEPEKFLDRLRNIAQVVTKISLLDLAVFKFQLSAFHRANGYNQLFVLPDADENTNPEDNSGNGTKNEVAFGELRTDLNQSAPEADWSSSPLSPNFSKIPGQNGDEISKNKLYPRTKQRSMSDLLTTTSRKRKKRKDSQVGIDSGMAKDYSDDHKSTNGEKQKTGKLSEPVPDVADKLDNKDFDVKNDDDFLETSKSGTLTRERKKSKYLSPPYTTLGRGNKSLFSLKNSEAEYLKLEEVSAIGEGDIISSGYSPLLTKCTSETYQKKHGRKPKSYVSSSPPPKETQKNLDLNEGNVNVEEMFSEFQLTALDPMYLKEKNSSETIRNFFAKFRSSMYHAVSGYEIFNTSLSASSQAGKKKLSLDSKHGSPKIGEHVTAQPTSEGQPKRRKRKRKVEATFQNTGSRIPDYVAAAKVKTDHNGGLNHVQDKPEPEQPICGDKPKPKKRRRKSKSERTGGIGFAKANSNGGTSSAALNLTFAPGVSLPSKDYLMKEFGKFGALDELKTEVKKDSSCASIVYTRSSDAEKALKRSQKSSPLGPAVVSYQLQYLPTSSKDSDHGENAAPGGDAPPLLFIKQNLKMMTTMLEKSGNNLTPEVKANLEAEINSLLKKVTTIEGDHNGKGGCS